MKPVANRQVRNILDFLRHITLHRKRVRRLAYVLLWKEGPSSWISTNAASRYFTCHDLEKYLFLPVLWWYYGDRRGKKRARSWYDLMNRVGNLISGVAGFVLGTSKEDLNQWKKCEKIADILDRHYDIVAREELAQDFELPMSDFLTEEELKLANSIMYEHHTSDLQYKRKKILWWTN